MRTSTFLLVGSALLLCGCGGNKGAGNNAAEANTAAANTATVGNTTASANTTAANTEEGEDGAPPANGPAAPAAPAAAAAASASVGACPILGSSDWLAEVHHHGKRVVVTGTVQVKSAGYRVALDEGDLDRGPPPVQHVKLKVRPPEGPAAQVVTRRPVQIVLRNAGPGEKVAIDCKGTEIARTDVVRP